MAESLSLSEIEAMFASVSPDEAENPPDNSSPQPLDVHQSAEISSVMKPAGSENGSAESRIFLPLRKRRRAQAAAALGPPYHTQSHPLVYEPYDFRKPSRLSREHLRSLQRLHETFAGLATSALSNHLRTPVQISVAAIEQVSYQEYVRSVSSSLIHVLNVLPDPSQILMEVDCSSLFSMIDRMLGGSGKAGQVTRDLTEIERALCDILFGLLLDSLQSAWADFGGLAVEVASAETSLQFVQIVPPDETVALVLLSVQMGTFRGGMCLCLPYSFLKKALEVKDSKHRQAKQRSYTREMAHRLQTASASCTARVGVTSVTVGQIVALEVGQVFPFQKVSQNGHANNGELSVRQVEVFVGEHLKFRGTPGFLGKHLAVQINEIIPS